MTLNCDCSKTVPAGRESGNASVEALARPNHSAAHFSGDCTMADANSTVTALSTLEPERRDAVLEAANKLELLADALVWHSHCAKADHFEDIEQVAEIVSSVARRQSVLARVIISALDGVSTDSTEDIVAEAHNG
jgi:hypothetical protein